MSTDFPRKLVSTFEDTEGVVTFSLRPELHNGRPAWDMDTSMYYSICWTPTRDGFGFWAKANLWTKTDDGQATGFVFETPEMPVGDGPSTEAPTWTKSEMPPMGYWTRGRPWLGDRTSGGRQMCLSPFAE